jgi:hypothetical protein
MHMDEVRWNLYIQERGIRRDFALVLVLVSMSGNQMGAIGRALDGDFAIGAAADGADFFAFGGAEAIRFALFADWARHGE